MDLMSVIGVFVNGLVAFSRWVSDNRLTEPLALVAVIDSGLLLMRLWPLFVNYFQQDIAQKRVRVRHRSNTQPAVSRRTRRGGFSMGKGTSESVNAIVTGLDRFMADLPGIQEVKEIVATLTQDQIDKLTIPLGIEFQKGMAQLTVTEMEATAKLREIVLRLLLYLNKVKLAAGAYPHSLEVKLESVYRAQEVAKGYAERIDMSGYRELSGAIQASAAADLLRDFQQGKEVPAPETVGLFLLSSSGTQPSSASQDVGDTTRDGDEAGEWVLDMEPPDVDAANAAPVDRVMAFFSKRSGNNGTERANGEG